MNRMSHNRWWMAAGVVAASGATFGANTAAFAGDGAASDGEQHVVVRVSDDENRKEDSRSEAMWSDGETKIRIKNHNGEIKVYVDGDKVFDADSIDELDGKGLDLGNKISIKKIGNGLVVIRDGEQVLRLGGGGHMIVGAEALDLDDLEVLDLGGRGFRFKGMEGFDADKLHELLEQARAAGGAFAFSADDDEGDHPPVMLGIMLSSGEDADLHLDDIDPGKVTVVTRVIEGLPAAKAGLMGGDIIIELDGLDSASPDAIMKFLGNEKPGQTIELKVLREGEEREIEIELEPYDPGKLGVAPESPGNSFSFGSGGAAMAKLQREMAEAAGRMAELSERLATATGRESRRLSKEVSELTARLAKVGAELARRSAEGNFSFSPDQLGFRVAPENAGKGHGGRWRLHDAPRFRIEENDDGARGYVIVRPDNDEEEIESYGPSGERMERLEKRLARLEMLLQKLVDQEEQ